MANLYSEGLGKIPFFSVYANNLICIALLGLGTYIGGMFGSIAQLSMLAQISTYAEMTLILNSDIGLGVFVFG